MDRRWWTKFILLLFFLGLAGAYVYPTLAKLDLEKTDFPFKQKINLGLDLQGGLYMVMGVDFDKVFKEVVERQAVGLKERLEEKSLGMKSVKVVTEGYPKDDVRVSIQFDSKNRDAVHDLIKEEFVSFRLTDEKEGEFQVGLARSYQSEVREKTIDQSIEVIRNRIDQFGVAEPTITSQGNDRIVVELPGVKEIQRAKELIGRTAKLEFKIVDDKTMSPGEVAGLIAKIEEEKNLSFKEGGRFSEYAEKINEFSKGKIPENRTIAFERVQDPETGEFRRIPYLLIARTEVTGDDLQDASVQFDPESRRPEVGFTFNPRGATLFEKLTGEHIQERLAIVLDNIVYSAPTIQSRIGARGRITLGQSGGDQVLKEAKDLAIVLRAGALPAQLEFMEQRVVGPTLGEDSIKDGAKAGLVGSLLVFLFILIYYRVSGVIAVVSLFANVIFVLAILVGLEATLTLPGIAGIALTVGIAVDSNVVIYERIREELRSGKSIGGAIDAGFQKALRTILDANITNAGAAIVLLMYGTGPIKGFAVTLLIGIITTLFTAVFVCRLFFQAYLSFQEKKTTPTLSI